MKQGQENNNRGRDTKTVNKTEDSNENVDKKASEQRTHLLKRKTHRIQKKEKNRGKEKEKEEASQWREIQEPRNTPHYEEE